MTNVMFDRCNCIACDFDGVNMDEINFEKTNVIDGEEESRINILPEDDGAEPQEK
jgi:hypothetical protein